jgi:regulator of cell morphogenesis and NO signaling
MKFNRTFSGTDTVIELIQSDYNILPILSRFNIPLGFQNKQIKEVCEENNINTDVFLFIVNYIFSGVINKEALNSISPVAIVDFLHNSHDYFLRYKFPHIRANLLNALDETHNNINPAIIMFFDSYLDEVKKHFNYEEKKVFPYIRGLINGDISTYNINIFKRHHDEIGEKLSELKNIILRFYTTSMPNKMYDVLVDIYNAEEDLETHNRIENDILVPIISNVEVIRSNKEENR